MSIHRRWSKKSAGWSGKALCGSDGEARSSCWRLGRRRPAGAVPARGGTAPVGHVGTGVVCRGVIAARCPHVSTASLPEPS